MIDWSILNASAPVDIAGNFARGYQMSTAIMDRMHERNALATLSGEPNNPSALASLYQVDPKLGAYFQERGAQQQTLARRQTLGAQYAGGDTRGAETAAISAGDMDLAKAFQGLDADQQKGAVDFWEKAGPVAYKLKQTTDPAARQALWAQAKPILQSEGVDQAQLDKFDPTNDAQLDAAITISQKVTDLINQGKIEWHQQGEMPSFATDATGHPIGTQNPAGAGSVPTVTDQKSYDAVPQGGHYVDPQGHMRVKGGQSASPAGGFQ